MNEVYEKLLKCYNSAEKKISFQPEIALILISKKLSTIMSLRASLSPLLQVIKVVLCSAMQVEFR